jgi:hypothetical protein
MEQLYAIVISDELFKSINNTRHNNPFINNIIDTTILLSNNKNFVNKVLFDLNYIGNRDTNIYKHMTATNGITINLNNIDMLFKVIKLNLIKNKYSIEKDQYYFEKKYTIFNFIYIEGILNSDNTDTRKSLQTNHDFYFSSKEDKRLLTYLRAKYFDIIDII